MTDRDLHKAHNDGQEDASDGKLDRPHNEFEKLTTWDSEKLHDMIEENKAYDEGHRNTRKQKEG